METISIGYCGKKWQETDHLYGTNLVWEPGTVHDVPLDKAKLLLQHEDVWFDARTKGEKRREPVKAAKAEPARYKDDGELPIAAKVHLMPKEDLVRYALTEFNERLDPSKPEGELRAEVNRLIHTRT